nr:carboxypeptidase B-like [Onthophagus taurus]
MKGTALFVIFLAVASADIFRYDGYKVYQVIPTNEIHAEVLKVFRENEEYDFWSKTNILGESVNIMVKPALQNSFVKILETNKIEYSILIDDAESVFQEERLRQTRAPKIEKGKISFDKYHRYEDIQAYLERLQVDYPVKVGTIGKSYEERELSYIQIGDNPNNPTIVLDGAIHAREWIAPAMALYLIQQLVENEEYAYLSENANWVIIPVLNPDGYEYTHTNNRMWRKTRSRGNTCYGVDANRNFGYMWGGLGTSSNECSDIYHGPYAHSEPEVAAFTDFVLGLNNVELYIALHSYGQWVIYPWGYDFILPDNVDDIHYLGERIADAIKSVKGTSYTVGNSAILLYPAAGCSDDWMKGAGGADLSYTLELPGGGSQGFDLPASRIYDVVIETFQGILAAYEYIVEK